MNARAIVGLGLLLVAGSLCAHEGHHVQPAATDPITAPPSEGIRDALTWFTDTQLLTQEGQEVRFYNDVLKDRVVLLNVIFTSCSDACPIITRKLRKVQEAMGSSADDVYFVSLTSDPLNDTPQVLKNFATRHGVDTRNWVFLTGSQADMELVLGRLGHLVPSPEQHSTELIAGNVPNKRWSRIRPDAPVDAIADRLKLLTRPLAVQ